MMKMPKFRAVSLVFLLVAVLCLLEAFHMMHINVILGWPIDLHETIAGVAICALIVAPAMFVSMLWSREIIRPSLEKVVVHLLPYLILLLALLSVIPANSEVNEKLDVFTRTRELASVLVLFALAELAAIIFDQLLSAKREMQNSLSAMRNATAVIQTNQAVAALPAIVTSELINLLNGWEALLRGASGGEEIHHKAREICFQGLAREYFREELRDLKGEIDPLEIPVSVRVDRLLGLRGGQHREQISFISTNTGFYAGVLAKMVSDLSALSGARLCMAIVTNVLPPHYWNWPHEDIWYEYKAVSDYRDALARAVMMGAQIDRIILVDKEKGTGGRSVLFPEDELRQALDWTMFYLNNGGFSASSFDENSDLEPIAQQQGLAKWVNSDYAPLYYPLSKKKLGELADLHTRGIREVNVREEYRRVMHGGTGGGRSWYLPLGRSHFLDPARGLGGCYDILFIGVSEADPSGKDLWTQETFNWSLGFMASMSRGSETMFLATIRDTALDALWRTVRSRVEAGRVEL